MSVGCLSGEYVCQTFSRVKQKCKMSFGGFHSYQALVSSPPALCMAHAKIWGDKLSWAAILSSTLLISLIEERETHICRRVHRCADIFSPDMPIIQKLRRGGGVPHNKAAMRSSHRVCVTCVWLSNIAKLSCLYIFYMKP